MKKYKVNLKKLRIVIILVLAILFVGTSLFALAQYVGTSVWDYYLNSQKFYFTSAHLDGTERLNNTWDGSPIAFELSNFNEIGEVSDHAISYDIKCNIIGDTTGNLQCKLNGTDLDEYSGTLQKIEVCRNDTSDGVDTASLDEETCNNRGYTWINGNTSLNQFFEVVSTDPDYVIEDVEVEIIAKATEPYSKTLSGTFKLRKTEEIVDDYVITHESFADYEKVIITNYSKMPIEFFLRWNASRLSVSKGDFSNQSITSDGYINEIEFKVESSGTVTYTFYKNNPSDTITLDNFVLVKKPQVEALMITSIQLLESSAGVTEVNPPTFTDNSTSIHLNLASASEKFTYIVTIVNTTNTYYHLTSIDEIANTANIDYVPTGMSLYHEFAPGTVTTFYIEYDGIGTITNNELMLDLKYMVNEGEIYKDDTLNGSTPEVIDGLVPIEYNESNGEWQKADVVNGHWYDYAELKWANAASVIESMRDFYSEAPHGTIVEMSHITSMLVWVPRYSYTIRDEIGYLGYGADTLSRATPGAIDIKFIGPDQLDTGNGQYSGNYPQNYYTSPAFCWGNSCDDPATRGNEENSEVKGFWVAKFEANKTGNILYSKPNLKPMSGYTIADTFYYVQDLMNGTNGYMNYGYVGYVDAHLIKNTEWGALAILSQSKYGKYGNTNYTGVNKEIYLNNCTSYVTGIGGSSAGDGGTTSTCNDDNHRYDSYNGMGASTTGNIYGVYDMIGGTFDRVMGVVLGPNGEFIPDYSGFTELPEGRYINVYPYGTYTIGDVSPIQGDALTETIQFYNDRYLNDPRFSSTNYYLYHWFYRGGSLFFSIPDANGIFSYTLFNGIADSHHASRFSLIMYGSVVDHL